MIYKTKFKIGDYVIANGVMGFIVPRKIKSINIHGDGSIMCSFEDSNCSYEERLLTKAEDTSVSTLEKAKIKEKINSKQRSLKYHRWQLGSHSKSCDECLKEIAELKNKLRKL